MLYNRKEFLYNSSLALSGILLGSLPWQARKKLLLSFSTLGCPDWGFPDIISFAKKHGYKGIEVRGIQRQMDLSLVPEFRTAERRSTTLAMMKDHGLKFVNLGSSANLHIAEEKLEEKNMDEARRFIDLAHQLDCPYVRVFPNNFLKGEEKRKTIERIATRLSALGTHAGDSGVKVLMETHGDLVYANDLLTIMQQVNNKNTGLVWDISNMWTITKAPPVQVYQQLRQYIFHVHVKDANVTDGKIAYTFLGKGMVPLQEAMAALTHNNYPGYYSFEWEKLWHPELAPPEKAFADYPSAIKQIMRRK